MKFIIIIGIIFISGCTSSPKQLESLYLETDSYNVSSNGYTSFWMKIIDQDGNPIDNAKIIYCNPFVRCAYKDDYSTSFSNNDGLLKLSYKAKNGINITGITKEGHDIRLSTLGYKDVRIDGSPSMMEIKYFNNSPIQPYISIRRASSYKLAQYDLPKTEPLITVIGFKLDTPSCLERGHIRIFNAAGPDNWDIDNDVHYFRVGGNDSIMQESDTAGYDFKLTINRKKFPWGSLWNSLFSSYQLKLEFRNGGGQTISRSQYVHLPPIKGYKNNIKINYGGVREIAGFHKERLFVKINNRYGILYIEITPSRKIQLAYFLAREHGSRSLDIPSYFSDNGRSIDYFDCPNGHYSSRITPAGECEKITPPCLSGSGFNW